MKRILKIAALLAVSAVFATAAVAVTLAAVTAEITEVQGKTEKQIRVSRRTKL